MRMKCSEGDLVSTQISDSVQLKEMKTAEPKVPEEEPFKCSPSSRKKLFHESGKRIWTTWNTTLLVLGVTGFAFALIMLCGALEAIMDATLQKKLQLAPGNEVEEIWRNTPVPMTMKVYFFNITNPDQLVMGETPELQEVGPYIYKKYLRKEKVNYHSNMTVSYNQNQIWVWDQAASGNLKLTDTITILNTIPVSAAYSLDGSDLILSSMNSLFNLLDEPLLKPVSVSEVLFDGYEDPLLDFTRDLAEGPLWAIPIPPGLRSFDKFAWFYKRNGSVTHDGIFNIYTGESGLDDIGKIDWWKYSNVTPYFEPPCNEVKGSSGEFWPPHFDQDHITFFNSDLCMSPKFYYLEDVEDDFGNTARRFWGSNKTFANYTYLPENKCYCVGDVCGPSGLLNAESCRMGAPTYVSFPHFLNADQSLTEHVKGIKPEKEKHMFFIDLNRELGIPLRVAARLQINIRLKPYPGKGVLEAGKIDLLKTVPDVILPILWFEILSQLSEEMAPEVTFAISMFSSNVPKIILLILLIFNLILVITVIYITILLYRRRRLI